MAKTIVLNKKGLVEPYYLDNHIRIFKGDARSMWELPNECVQMVCTSPPFWGLRKYAGEQDLIWGGDNHCEHKFDMPTMATLGFNTLFRPEGETSTPLGLPSDIGKYAETVKGGADRQQKKVVDNFCSLCGAWKGAYGLEPTPEMYVEHTIEILREIKRVLRKDGVVFWNIGDSYAGSGSPGGDFRDGKGGDEYLRPYNRKGGVLKPKDLCLIPFRVALAAQEDGWWVRSVIIWDKNNPMPESVNGWRWERHRIKVANRGRKQAAQKGHFQDHSGNEVISDAIWQDCSGCPTCEKNDGYILRKGSWRPTESHEFILMLTKSDNYFCDKEAVKEEYTEPLNRWGGPELKRDTSKTAKYKEMQNIGYSSAFRVGRPMRPDPGGRNLRSVWSFPTVPYPGAHFAVFPEKLPQLCIKAATPEVGCCSKCGAPWARIVEVTGRQVTEAMRVAGCDQEGGYQGTEQKDYALANAQAPSQSKSRILESMSQVKETIGWRPSCKCNAPRVPSLVLDPLMGAGTTLKEAKNLNRYAVGYELAEEYCQLAVERCRQQVLV